MSEIGADDEPVRLERLIPSPPEALFALWTEPAELARWWAPEGFAADVQSLDAQAGGHWRVVLRGAGGRAAAMSGVYRVVEPPRRLIFTWAWEDEAGGGGHESQVTATFEPAPGGSRLVVLHERFENRAALQRHRAGWASALDRLAEVATEPGTTP